VDAADEIERLIQTKDLIQLDSYSTDTIESLVRVWLNWE